MSLESTSAAGTSPVKPLEFKESESVEALTKLICGEMQNKLETKANEGVAQEKRRTSRSKYLRKVIQSLEDLEPDKKGVFNIEGHPKLSKIEQDLQQYEKQAKSYEEEACQLEEEACQLEEEACQLEAGAGASKNMKDGHSKRLAKEKKIIAEARRNEAAEIRDVQESLKFLSEKKLTKEQKNKVVDNCKSCVDDFSSIGDLKRQELQRLNSVRHQFFQLNLLIIKSLHNAKIGIVKRFG